MLKIIETFCYIQLLSNLELMIFFNERKTSHEIRDPPMQLRKMSLSKLLDKLIDERNI